MKTKYLTDVGALSLVGCLGGLALSSPVAAQIPGQNPLNESPLRTLGQNEIPVYDCWF